MKQLIVTALRVAAPLVVACAATPYATGVMLSTNGIGQALVFPYYTVRETPYTPGSQQNTLLSIVNKSDRAKAVKVRFYEANAGAPVFDANVFLSKGDVWVAALLPSASGAAIFTPDQSCNVTATGTISSSSTAPSPFANAAYIGDGVGDSIDRTKEGYFEVLEMGTVVSDSQLEMAVSHSAGSPSCVLPPFVSAQLDPPSGGLYGAATIINVLEGTAYSYDATAFEKWSDATQFTDPAATTPTIASASPFVSAVIDDGKAYTSTWTNGADAVSAVLMASGLEFEYQIESAVAGATDVVVTMPTKRQYVDSTAARPPYSLPLRAAGPCEEATDVLRNREELWIRGGLAPDLLPPNWPRLCSTTTVLSATSLTLQTIPPSAPLGSQVAYPFMFGYGSAGTSFYTGVERMAITGSPGFGVAPPTNSAQRKLMAVGSTTILDLTNGSTTSRDGVTYLGLPMLGTSFIRYVNAMLLVNGKLTLSNYGTNSTPRFSRTIVVPQVPIDMTVVK